MNLHKSYQYQDEQKYSYLFPICTSYSCLKKIRLCYDCNLKKKYGSVGIPIKKSGFFLLDFPIRQKILEDIYVTKLTYPQISKKYVIKLETLYYWKSKNQFEIHEYD